MTTTRSLVGTFRSLVGTFHTFFTNLKIEQEFRAPRRKVEPQNPILLIARLSNKNDSDRYDNIGITKISDPTDIKISKHQTIKFKKFNKFLVRKIIIWKFEVYYRPVHIATPTAHLWSTWIATESSRSPATIRSEQENESRLHALVKCTSQQRPKYGHNEWWWNGNEWW